MLITAADFAKLKKVSKPAVSKAIKSGRLKDAVVNQGGRSWLHQERAFDLWERNTDPSQQFRGDKVEEIVATPDGEIPSFNASRARTEHLKAELLQLEFDEKAKTLVKSDEVKADWLQIVTIARTKVLGIPSKAKQRIPDLDTNAMTMLEEIVRETLEDLAVENVQAA